MSNLSVSAKDYQIYNLQIEYKKISDYVYRLSSHINKLFDNLIINVISKNSSLGKINDIIRKLNTAFNNSIISIHDCDDDNDITTILNDNMNLFCNLKELSHETKINKIKYTNNILNNVVFAEHFPIIKKDIISICTSVGFPSINTALSLLNINVTDDHSKKLINIYNDIFVPFSYNEISMQNNTIIYFKKLNIEKEGLIDNCYSLYIKNETKNNTYIELYGYFNYDNMNIIMRTSQICNDILYIKKRNIETKLNGSTPFINDNFKKSYIKNSTIKDFITMSENEYLSKIEKDYNKYIQLIKCSFIDLMKEFIKNDVNNMLIIIKLLLLGSDENINVAGLLYGLTKDKKVGSDTVANIIYKNLSYMSQIKLRKTNITIKNELERIKSLTIEDVDLKKQVIALNNMPDNVKSIALEKIEEMKTSNTEYYKQQLFVKTLCKFPWSSENDNKLFEDLQKDNNKSKEYLDEFENKIDNVVYGHDHAKKELKQLVGKWISNPNSAGSAIGLYGPPGVGKTLFAKGIGEALDIPFAQISLGGQNDGELLYGHGYAYQGSQPGMVLKKMIEAGSARCVLYFDELDKTAQKHGNTNEITSILIHMTDPNMNSEFQDRFFQGINFPLDKVLMVFSYNDPKLVDRILLDRLNKISVEAYTSNDKIHIVEKFIIKEMSELIGHIDGSIVINKDNIEYIIENYTLEAGVRELKRCIEKIFLRLNIDKIYKRGIFQSKNNNNKNNNNIVVDKETIVKYLDKSKIHIEKIHEMPLIGVINGLYASTIGKGGIVPIQIYKNEAGFDDKFILKLTGCQKEVMKESVVVALTTAIHQLNKSIRTTLLKKFPHGFHIHTPDGSTPKDGPSAGAAFTVAFVSRILNKKIKNDIAMTGEIELTGKVTKIGGLLYKLTGAKKAGVKHVYCSIENKEDIDNIMEKNDKLIDDSFKVTFVSNVKEIIKYVIVNIKESELEMEI
jgi:endopeptidase La